MTDFPAFVVRRSESGGVRGAVERLRAEQLPDADPSGPAVEIDVQWSSLNYKDALACGGHAGVAPRLPHVPGIDCAGTILGSGAPDWPTGTPVLVTGYGLGAPSWGGWSGRVRVPAAWLVPLPNGLSMREAMVLGTAGFTAAQCVQAIVARVEPDDGEVLVTGATGGVGSLAVAILARLGYEVVASSGKPEHATTLAGLGAARVIDRESVRSDDSRPMVSARWSAAVDTVGGGVLADVIRATGYRGVVAACGLVGGDRLESGAAGPLSVLPFLLRGVWLAGIDSAQCPREPRLEVWRRLAGPWRVALPESLVAEVSLSEVDGAVQRILAGKIAGRTLVRLAE